MEKLHNEILLKYTDQHINTLINKNGEESKKPKTAFSVHYNQNEEMFLKFDQPINIPSFPIHHDISISTPHKKYLAALREIMNDITSQHPALFNGMTYFFDPTEIFHPCYFQLYRTKEKYYLFLIRLDLHLRTHECTILDKGGNDNTHTFSTNNLHLESDLIPLQSVDKDEQSMKAFYIDQVVSQTWIGETGRGYVVSGIWMDNELTKYFSKLFLPKEKRSYPYYPFMCKYRTITHSVINLLPEGRKKHLIYLHNAIKFLTPRMLDIEKTLKHRTFSMDLSEFIAMKKEVSPYWNNIWESLRVKPYLNELDMKEYLVEFKSP